MGTMNFNTNTPLTAAVSSVPRPSPAPTGPANDFVVLDPKYITRQPLILDRLAIAELSIEGKSFTIRTTSGRKMLFPVPTGMTNIALRDGLLDVLFNSSVLASVKAIGEVTRRYIHPSQIESMSLDRGRAVIVLRGGNLVELPATTNQQSYSDLVSVICGEEVGLAVKVSRTLPPVQAAAPPVRPTKQATMQSLEAREVAIFKASQPKPFHAGRTVRVGGGRMEFIADIDDAMEKIANCVRGFAQEQVMENTELREVYSELDGLLGKLRVLSLRAVEDPDSFLNLLERARALVERFPKMGNEYIANAHRLFNAQVERFSTIRALAKAAA